MKELVKELAGAQKENLRRDFEHFHQNPELSFKEYQTAEYIRNTLKELGIPMQEGISGTGTVGILKGSEPGPVIAFRADIDALPVHEINDLPYRSQTEGIMHACGHDSHTATLLGLARVLSSHPELVKGTVKFLFQPAEEKLPGGAKQLCADGAIDDVDMVFGLHAGSGMDLGTIELNRGPISAAVCTYEVQIHGAGGHGSSPHTAKNPVPVACMIGSAINQIRAEKVDPLANMVLTVSYIESGKYPNVIPAEAKLGGNFRTLDNSLVEPVLEEIQKVSKGICDSYGLTCDFDIVRGYPANVNSDAQVDIMADALNEMGFHVVQHPPMLGAEDFSYYSLKKPSAFIMVGAADPERPITYSPHHSSEFQIDERVLDIALECEIATYLKATKQA